MRKTLLEMTQTILSAMEDDEVNSISDTVSSEQVATTIETCFNEMIAQLDLSGMDTLMRLEAVSDVDRPTHLKIPDNVKTVHWMRYRDVEVKYKEPGEFISLCLRQDPSRTIEDFGGGVVPIRTDRDPIYWTSFDDTYLVFDSINLDLESTLMASNSLIWASRMPTFVMEDSYVPALPANLHPTLLSMATARCFVNQKQISNNEEVNAARKGLVRHQNDQHRARKRRVLEGTPNYGKPRR